MDVMKGWIRLYRSVQDNWVWKGDEPFDRRSAWIDILLNTNHKTKKIVVGNQLIVVEAGSFITSEVKLSEAWGWSRKKVRNFLELLAADQMIEKKSDNKKTIITVLNWSEFQSIHESNLPEKEQGYSETESQSTGFREHQRNINGTSTEHQRNTNKNDKNNNNIKKIKNDDDDYIAASSAAKKAAVVNCHDEDDEEEKAIDYWQSNMGLLNGVLRDNIIDLVAEVGIAVYKRAVDKSILANKRSFRYVDKVARGIASGDDWDNPKAANSDSDPWEEAMKTYKEG